MAGELIPSIDVSSLKGSQAERMRCAKAIGRACEEVGFFHIVGHGVNSGQRVRVFDVAERFFALPLATKMEVALSAESRFRGYFPFKGEVTDPLIGGDPKEGYDISFAPDDDAHGRGNRWPEEPRRSAGGDDGVLSSPGRARPHALSRGFALALDLPEDFFAAKLDRPTAILRLLHYPPVGRVPARHEIPLNGCGAHSDYGYLTVLAQDEQGGLQVEARPGQWIDVPPKSDADFAAHQRGERAGQATASRATPHRVIRVAPKIPMSHPVLFPIPTPTC